MLERQIISRKEARALGLKHFFTGQPCIRGHIAIRYVSKNNCRDCLVEDHRTNYAKNPTKENARTRAWWSNNEEYRSKNAELFRERARRWYAENKERSKRTTLEWQRSNPDKKQQYSSTRRARKRLSAGTHTAEQLRELLEKQNYECVYCRGSLRERRHTDHIVALARGGSNGIENIQLLCPSCNSSKGDKSHEEFLQYRARMGSVRWAA